MEFYLTQQQQQQQQQQHELSPYIFDFSGSFTVPAGGDMTNDLLQTPYVTKSTI